MPEAIKRHYFLNQLEKDWKTIEENREAFPREMLSDLLKSNWTSLITAYRHDVPIAWLARYAPESLQDCQGDLTRLQVLDLSGNQLSTVPRGIEYLAEVRELNLNGNRLTSLPPKIGDLKQLRRLTLWRNDLITLSDDIQDLTHLEKLDLTDNHLTTLPDGLGRLPHLRRLDLHKNALSPQTVLKLIGDWCEAGRPLNRRGGLYMDCISADLNITLSDRDLSQDDIPDNFRHLRDARRLDLRDNRFTQIPDALLCAGAREINLQGNPLLPEAIADAHRRIDALRQQGHPVPQLVLPDHAAQGVNELDRLTNTKAHNRRLTTFFGRRIDLLAAQFPQDLRGTMDQQRERIGVIQTRLTEALTTCANDHPEIDKAREVATAMLKKALGLKKASFNDFHYSPGHVLSYVMLHIERVRDSAPAERQDEVFNKGIRLLTDHLAFAHDYCDTRQIEEVMTAVAIPFDADEKTSQGTIIPIAPLPEHTRDAVYGEAKKALPKLLAEYPDLRDDDEQLQNAFRLHLKELVQAEHKNIPVWQTAAYIDEQIIPYWEAFKENALDAEEKPAAVGQEESVRKRSVSLHGPGETSA